MTFDEFRQKMEEYWREVDQEEKDHRYPYLAIKRMETLYGRFDPAERAMADEVLAEWVFSEDERRRFDAFWLIEDLKLASAAPALRTLASQLASSRARGAASTLERVRQILEKLGSSA